MSETAEVLIVGGGAIGLSIAYFLAKEGTRVTLVDQGDFGTEASWAGAGMLTGADAARATTPLGRLKGLSSAAFPALSAELRERTGLDNGYRRCGAFELSFAEDAATAARLAQVKADADGEGERHRPISSDELRTKEPALEASLAGGLEFPDAAQVRNPRHLKALLAACRGLGVRLIPHCPIVEMKPVGDRITQVRGRDQSWSVGQVVVAAGAWTDQLLPAADRQGIKPIRGQMLLLKLPKPPLTRMLMVGSRYVVPRDDGRTLVGSTEEDVGFVKANTAEALADLRRFAEALVPGLREADEEARWSGLRPFAVRQRPALGPMPGLRNLFVAAGHFRSGLQLSPITGMILAKLLRGEAPGLDLAPFAPAPRPNRSEAA